MTGTTNARTGCGRTPHPYHSPRRLPLLALAALLASPALALAQGPEVPSAVQPPRRPAAVRAEPRAGWVDFQRAQWRLDGALADGNRNSPALAEAADMGVMNFSRGSVGAAIQMLNDIADVVSTGSAAKPAQRTLDSVGVRLDPPVASLSDAPSVSARVLSMYATLEPDAESREFPFELVLRPTSGADAVSFDGSFVVGDEEDPGETTLTIDASGMKPGSYRVFVRMPESAEVERGWFYVVERPLDEGRDQREARLSALADEHKDADDPLRLAIETCLARNALVTDSPAPDATYQSTTDLLALRASVEQEIAALEDARNPYRALTGEHWRGITIDTEREGVQHLSVLVNAPAGVEGAKPGLVICVPGMGADETTFARSLGRGRSVDLANERGWVVATVSLRGARGYDVVFDRILESLSADYDIDPDRVVVIGHSMSGVTAIQWARDRRDKIAAAACVCGFGRFDPANPPAPVLVIAAESDPIFPIDRLEQSIGAAAAQGLNVVFRRLDGMGHVTAAAPGVEQGVRWAIDRAEADAPDPK